MTPASICTDREMQSNNAKISYNNRLKLLLGKKYTCSFTLSALISCILALYCLAPVLATQCLAFVTSEASPHCGVEWKTSYCHAWPYLVCIQAYIYVYFFHTFIIWRVHGLIYGLDSKRNSFFVFGISRKLAVDSLDSEMIVNDEENSSRFEGKNWIRHQLIERLLEFCSAKHAMILEVMHVLMVQELISILVR